MNFVKLFPVFISALLFAAHCLRLGASLTLAICCLAFPLVILLFPKRWAAISVQAYLIIASAEWLRTLYVIIMIRISMEEPWMRFALIIGGVALFTAGSGCVFFAKSLKKRYKLDISAKLEGEISS